MKMSIGTAQNKKGLFELLAKLTLVSDNSLCFGKIHDLCRKTRVNDLSNIEAKTLKFPVFTRVFVVER